LALAEAASLGQRERVWQLVGPRTRKRLEDSAALLAATASRRRIEPYELLATGWFPPKFRIDEAQVSEREDDHAWVELESRAGDHDRVECVREGGFWKVELP
jgi:hypothetical protein